MTLTDEAKTHKNTPLSTVMSGFYSAVFQHVMVEYGCLRTSKNPEPDPGYHLLLP